jgi:hypothetical protein
MEVKMDITFTISSSIVLHAVLNSLFNSPFNSLRKAHNFANFERSDNFTKKKRGMAPLLFSVVSLFGNLFFCIFVDVKR